MQSIQSQSSNGPGSPQHSFSRDSLADMDGTLGYLGLEDTPQPARATLAPSQIELLLEAQRNQNQNHGSANRSRSYSLNATANYVDDEGESDGYGGTVYDLQEDIQQHNLEVQHFTSLMSSAVRPSAVRPRASTAGMLDSQIGRASCRERVF